MSRNQIAEIRVKSPPGIFGTGQLLKVLKSGDSLQIKIGKKGEFDALYSPMQAFDSTLVKAR